MIEIFDLILAAGPYFVFAGMGQNQNSGKLLFRSLTSSNSTVIFTEDATSITFSSIGTGVSIPVDKIVYGTGDGITYSIFGVDTRSNYESITGLGNLVPYLTSGNNNSTLPTTCNNLNVGGNSNVIKQVSSQSNYDNVLIGGYRNQMIGHNNNVIVSGDRNCISESRSSAIVAGQSSCIYKSNSIYKSENNAIISSRVTCVIDSCNSSMISSRESKISDSYQSIILSSKYSQSCSDNSSVISSCYSCVTGFYNNTILSSQGTSTSLSKISCSKFSLMSSSLDSLMQRSNYSSIFSSQGSNIYAYQSQPTPELLFRSSVWDSAIFSGSTNSIVAFSSAGTSSICSSAILSGECNRIWSAAISQDRNIKASVIVTGQCNLICTGPNLQPSNSIILSGFRNLIGGSPMSAIVSGASNSLIGSTYSVITNGNSNFICNSVSSVIISGTRSGIFKAGNVGKNPDNSLIISNCDSSINVDSNNLIIAGRQNNIGDNSETGSFFICNNIVLGGCQNRIFGLNATIIGGNQNCICLVNGLGDKNSQIIAGNCNKISGISTPNNVIIGGYKNLIEDKTYTSVIIGGRFNNINAPNAVTVGGTGLTNSTNNSAMFSELFVKDILFVNGVTGFSGTWSSGTPFTMSARGGIITIF